MKLLERVKKILFKRTINNLFQRNTEEEVNEAVLFLRLWNDNSRVIPYSLFEEECLVNYNDIIDTPQGHIFKHWLLSNTISIEKSFNKSRKITRKIKDIESKLFVLDTPVHFNSALTSLFGAFFIDLTSKTDIATFSFSDEIRMRRVLEDITICLSLLIYIDGLTELDKVENLLDFYVNSANTTNSNQEIQMKLAKIIEENECPLASGV